VILLGHAPQVKAAGEIFNDFSPRKAAHGKTWAFPPAVRRKLPCGKDLRQFHRAVEAFYRTVGAFDRTVGRFYRTAEAFHRTVGPFHRTVEAIAGPADACGREEEFSIKNILFFVYSSSPRSFARIE
jgi:hypothetical protein